jgi:hypothetical protein
VKWWPLFRRDPGDGREAEQRAQPRVDGHAQLTCSLGEIMDISMTGVRIACRGRVPDHAGKLEKFTLGDAQQQVPFTARVVRVNPTGFRRFELGLEFVGLSVQEQGVLRVLARIGPHATHAAPRKPRASEGGRDHYQVLGVSSDATPAQIRHAYLALARKYHPDASQRGETARLFQRVHEAYSVLKDAESRREYDGMRSLGAV